MQFRTEIDIPQAAFTIEPNDRLLFTGSCFADNIGRRFTENHFDAAVNPFGVMYNPASVMHTVERYLVGEEAVPDIAVLTLGTNHVYILKETGEIVDNCMKRPQRLFEEKALSVDECKAFLSEAIAMLRERNPQVKVILTVSPIRYAKYGFHGSQLSKATLLLAVDALIAEQNSESSALSYFPAYEIINDELRDYRFYAPDMLHPSEQAVDFIYERFADSYFSATTKAFIKEWLPIKAALAHRPFNPENPEYKVFLAKAKEDEKQLLMKFKN